MSDTVRAIARGVREGLLDPVELAEDALRRAEEMAGFGAVVHLDHDHARRRATEVARTRSGALAGVPLLVKEIIAVKGMPWRCGSRVFADRVAASDAEIVRRANEAGAVVIGLSHSHEFAYGCTGTSNVAGPCRNPHDPIRMTGGSSSGSAAAVAAGIVPLALGTDTAGSVRIPAALCGVVGAKPARHTLPCDDGVFPLSTSLDHVGVLTRSVADAWYATNVLAGRATAMTRLTRPPLLGLPSNPEPRDAADHVAAAFYVSVEQLIGQGARMVEVRLPAWRRFTTASLDLQGREATATHARNFARQPEDYQPDVQARLEAASRVTYRRYLLAHELAATLTEEMTAVLSTVDAVALPTTPITAPPISAEEDDVPSGRRTVRELLLRDNRLANVTGHAALSVPMPTAGMPAGLQLIGADEQRLFAVADWVDRIINDREETS